VDAGRLAQAASGIALYGLCCPYKPMETDHILVRCLRDDHDVIQSALPENGAALRRQQKEQAQWKLEWGDQEQSHRPAWSPSPRLGSGSVAAWARS
jgi:hypothetical protein